MTSPEQLSALEDLIREKNNAEDRPLTFPDVVATMGGIWSDLHELFKLWDFEHNYHKQWPDDPEKQAALYRYLVSALLSDD